MKKFFSILSRCSLFRGVSEADLGAMLSCLGAKVVSVSKKETVLAEGDPVRYIGIVLSGSVQIIQMDYFGNRSLVANAEPAELFGESFACAGVSLMPVSVVAGEDSEILLIDHARVVHPCSNACDFHRKLVDNLLKVVAMKNLIFHQKVEITSKRTTREKLMAYLMLEAKKQDRDCFEIPYDRQELADYLGVDRSGLSAEIGKLRREGILESDRKRFKLL